MLPQVISGTSAGALVASFVGVRSDSELRSVLNSGLHEHIVFNDEPLLKIIRRLWSEGHLCDTERWSKRIQWFTNGNTTFAEAYVRTGIGNILPAFTLLRKNTEYYSGWGDLYK